MDLIRSRFDMIGIDGIVSRVVSIRIGTRDYLPYIVTEDGCYVIAQDKEQAGRAAVRFWLDLAKNNPVEFANVIGVDTLVKWVCGQFAGPGDVTVRGLAEWLEVVKSHPEETWGCYDTRELDITAMSQGLFDFLCESGWWDYRDFCIEEIKELSPIAYLR